MIRHSVIFTFKSSVDAVAMNDFFTAAKKLATIPGVERFESLRQVSEKNKYAFGLSMEFASTEVYGRYNAHPMHTEFITQYWQKYVADFLETDFEVLDG